MTGGGGGKVGREEAKIGETGLRGGGGGGGGGRYKGRKSVAKSKKIHKRTYVFHSHFLILCSFHSPCQRRKKEGGVQHHVEGRNAVLQRRCWEQREGKRGRNGALSSA
jgi:hypothetical protein